MMERSYRTQHTRSVWAFTTNWRDFPMPYGYLCVLCMIFVFGLNLSSKAIAQTKRALLVGVNQYPFLNEDVQREGPGNSVILMEDLLLDFGFADVRKLHDTDPTGTPDKLPTKANIENQMKKLIADTKAGDQIVLYFTGHGAQQPAPENSTEPDGKDELFLPRDTKGWAQDGEQGTVQNAIVDDQIGQWLDQLKNRKALVTVILDCCHSGEGIRGDNDQALRAPTKSLKIPAKLMTTAHRGENATKVDSAPLDGTFPKGFVALYACRMNQLTLQEQLPAPDHLLGQIKEYAFIAGKPRAGFCLFTHTLYGVLKRAKANGRILSYSQWIDATFQNYATENRGLVPYAVGSHREAAVFGTTKIDRSPIVIRQHGTQLRVNTGLLFGYGEGTILAVYPSVGELSDDRILGYVRITQEENFGVTNSRVIPEKYRGRLPVVDKKILVGGQCKVIESGKLGWRLPVVVRNGFGGIKAKPNILGQLQATLKSISAKKQWLIRMGKSSEDSDWSLMTDGKQVFLCHRDVVNRMSSTTKEFPKHLAVYENQGKVFSGPALSNLKEVANWCEEHLLDIARVRNLRTVVRKSNIWNEFPPVSVNTEVFKLTEEDVEKYKKDGEFTGIVGFDIASLIPVNFGELIGFKVTNTSDTAIDVNLIYISSQCQLEALFPNPESDITHRILPGKSRWLVGQIGTRSQGLENLLVIAVKSPKAPPVRFDGLVQRSPKAKHRGNNTPLGKLFDQAMYFKSPTGVRVRGDHALDEYYLKLISFDVMPK